MNRLAGETSPYLLQHRDNPVHWWPWCDEAFAEAARTNRPVLLSVGYAACHWCHVMAHESFEDPGIAGVMNELFVNVKVDREERPDVDHVYMSALHALGVPGGWPLTMFLTPDRRPFWGGTYFPPDARHGRPGFADVLRTVSGAFRSDPARIEASADAVRDALRGLAAAHAGGLPDAALLDEAAAGIAGLLDPVAGGFRGAPKFPNFPALDLVWRRGLARADGALRAPVLAALEGMSRGGIYDHLGGGIARYAVDDRWLVPHFEKMLYDNALYLRSLARAWRATRLPMLAARARETAAWMLREMRAGPAFASSLDADSEGEEGRYYVWDAAEIDAILGADAPRFRAAYGVLDGGNWEGRNILHRLGAGPWSEEEDAALRPLRERLLARRGERPRPGFDDKVLADWNGLAAAALAEAGAAFGAEAWVEAARGAFGFVASEMARGDRLLHAWRAGAARHAGLLDDYAFLADAALALHDAGALPEGPERAAAWMGVLGDRFAAEGGGYWRTADDAEELVARSRTGVDDATPSGAGVAADVQARLWQLTGEARWREGAEGALAASMGAAARSPAAFPTLLAAADTLLGAVQVVVEPAGDAARGAELLRAAREAPPVARTIRALAPGEALHEGHPARGMPAGDGGARAYVCRGNACSLPVADAAALAELLGVPAPPVAGAAGVR